MAIFTTFSRSILCAVFFLASTNRNSSNAFLQLEEECKNYNHSVNFLQITPFNQIVRISLCDKNQTQSIGVKDSRILTFDVNVAKNFLIYATEEGKLFRKSLDTGRNLPELLSEYKWFKVTQLAIDWIHDLLYMVADGSDLIVTSMSPNNQKANNSFNRITLLQSSSSRTIKKLIVYPKLSVLIWHEIDWLESVTNRIQMSKQDGTSVVNIYTINTYIYDLQIDHFYQMLYFIAQEELVQVSLFPLDYYKNSQQQPSSKSFSLENYDMRRFALLQPGFVQLAYYSLFFHFFNPTSSVLENIPTKANFLINFRGLEKYISLNNDFVLAYPLSQPRRMQPLCPKNFCSELCVPNGYEARFTCLCYSQDVPCGDDGHYHSEHLQTTTKTTTTTTTIPPPPIILQSNFSEHIFWKNVLERSATSSDPDVHKSDPFLNKLEVKFDQTQESSNLNKTENDPSEQPKQPNFNNSADHSHNLLISFSVNLESSQTVPDEKLMLSSSIGNFPHGKINLIENWIQKHRSMVCGALILIASIVVALSLAIVTKILKATQKVDRRKISTSKPLFADKNDERKIGLDESVKVLSVNLLSESMHDEELELLKTKNLSPNHKIRPIFDSSIAYDNWEYENVHLNTVVSKQPVANYCNLKCPNLETI